jgi:hypothetical protein
VKNIKLLPQRFDVAAVQAELASTDAWNKYPWRTNHPKSPHREVSDIWLRYNAIDNLGPHFNDPHEAVWYDFDLPETTALAKAVSQGAKRLGGVLITKVPAGAQVYPHVDYGWHALYYQKIAVQIQGNEEQAFCYDDGQLSALPGESYWFDNQAPHWVKNNSPQDRITLICCMRID